MDENNLKELLTKINGFCSLYNLNGYIIDIPKPSYHKIIETLEKITIRMEQRIQREYKHPLTSEHFEINFMKFTCNCMNNILNEYDKNEDFKILSTKLFSHRHFGYAFFNTKKDTLLTEYEAVYRTAYLSLAKFYHTFWGDFFDNENAIELLCNYFPPDSWFDEKQDTKKPFDETEQEKIIDGLINHVKNAGNSNDVGYAFNGLQKIADFIHNLPINMIKKLLNRYRCIEIQGNIQRRKQIFTILLSAYLQDDFEHYKFLYLDSILIMEMLMSIYNEQQKALDNSTIYFYPETNMPINQKLLTLEDTTKNKYTLLIENEHTKRTLRKSNGESLFEVFIEKSFSEKNIIIIYQGKKIILDDNWISDWISDITLNNYNKQFFLKLKQTLINNNIYAYISYKLVYLNNYHGMKQQKFYFDKRFSYEEKTITYDNTKKQNIPLKYSSNIQSIHAIVGKNGTGKTSLVNFLGYDFVNIMFELEERGATVSSIMQKYTIMNHVEFLVVFEIKEHFYYISNINNINVPKNIQYYMPNQIGSIKRTLNKIFYYSNKLDINELFETKRNELTVKEKNKIVPNLDIWGTKDYSEQRTLLQRINWKMNEIIKTGESLTLKEKKERNFFNRELFFQLLFLRDYFDNEHNNLNTILWDNFSIEQITLGDRKKDEIVQAFIKKQEKNISDWKTIFYEPKTLQYFSSGQYARFNFLAKLYWIVKGYYCNPNLIKELGIEQNFYENEIIEENDSAILFIDEGDLYYHPEWQRLYISDLCKIIEEATPCRLQIIIATNSPFILSDIFEDNIIFLSEKETDIKTTDKTFGQNIHTLLKTDFFMKYTIGEFARETISQIFKVLESPDYASQKALASEVSEIFKFFVLSEHVYDLLYRFADCIGEDIYRKHILHLIDSHTKNNSNARINYLKLRQKEIETELKALEGEKDK